MTFKFACPHCGQHISATSADSGMEAPCPDCANILWVPTIVAELPPTNREENAEQTRTLRKMPAVLVAALCCVVSAGLVFFLAKYFRAAPDEKESVSSSPVTGQPAVVSPPKQPGGTLTSAGQISVASAARGRDGIARLRTGQTLRASGSESNEGGEASRIQTGIWPTRIYPTGLPLSSESSDPVPAGLDDKGVSLMAELSAIAATDENISLAADAAEKLEYLKKAFRVESRAKLPVYQEMRDAILAKDNHEYHRQANTVNAIGVFNNATSFCDKDELFQMATLLQVVMDAKTSIGQKESIEKMQELLDGVRARQGRPVPGSVSLQTPPQ